MILLVDDESWLADMYCTALKAEGYEVLLTESAESTLEQLDNHGESIKLLILDIMMPNHNGIEVLYEMVGYSDWAHIKTIVLSNVFQKELAVTSNVWEVLGVAKVLEKSKITPKMLAIEVKEVLT